MASSISSSRLVPAPSFDLGGDRLGLWRGRWWLLSLLAALALIGTQMMTALVLDGLARTGLRERHRHSTDNMLEEVTGILATSLQQDSTPGLLSEHLRVVRDAHRLDVIQLVDGEGRVCAAGHLGASEIGRPISVFEADPSVLAATRRTDAQRREHVLVDGHPVERIYQPIGDRVLILERGDDLASSLQALDGPLRLGLVAGGGLGILVTVGIVLTGLALLRSQRRWVRVQQLGMLGALAASIAHEVKNPLGIVLSSVQLLRRRAALSARDRELTVQIEEELRRADEHLHGMLDLTRDLPLDLAAVDLRSCIDKAVFLSRARAARAGVTIVCTIPAGLVVRGDARRLQQAALNIILNAIEAMEDDRGDQLAITGERRADTVVVRFSDNGPGLSVAVRRQLFEPFVTTKQQGTGLGLVSCRRCLERHRGAIDIVSRGEGTTVAWRLPYHDPEASDASAHRR